MTATPAPIAVPSLSVIAEPSAFAFAPDLARLRRVSAPPAVTVRPFAIRTSVVTSAMLIAIAAATETEPSDDEADGSFAVPESPTPLAEARSSAKPRCVVMSLSTVLPDLSSAGAPAADAVAVVEVVEVPIAWKLTVSVGSSPASIERFVHASTTWFA